MIEELLNLHRGQGMDLFWRDSLTCPTEEEYVQMVLGSELDRRRWCRGQYLMSETGGLFRIAVKLMMERSQSDM